METKIFSCQCIRRLIWCLSNCGIDTLMEGNINKLEKSYEIVIALYQLCFLNFFPFACHHSCLIVFALVCNAGRFCYGEQIRFPNVRVILLSALGPGPSSWGMSLTWYKICSVLICDIIRNPWLLLPSSMLLPQLPKNVAIYYVGEDSDGKNFSIK